MKSERTALGQMKLIELSGKTFGKYLVIERRGSNVRGEPLWLCRCACGEESLVLGRNLRRGHSTGCRSCGQIKHGQSGRNGGAEGRTPEYRIWSQAKARCTNPKNAAWEHYGGRGIGMCSRWVISFEAFISDMGRRPSASHSIDRKDNNGHYEPSNCRWATITEQRQNTRRNVQVTFLGQTKCVSKWARDFGVVSPECLNARLKLGWDMKRALSTPVRSRT